MPRTCLFYRNKKILSCITKFEKEREELKTFIKKARRDQQLRKDIMEYILKLDRLPRNSSRVRYVKRCAYTNKARGGRHKDIFNMCGYLIYIKSKEIPFLKRHR